MFYCEKKVTTRPSVFCFANDDVESIVTGVFLGVGSCQALMEMLNNVMGHCFHFHPRSNQLQPGKEDKKRLFRDIEKDLKRAEETLHILSHQYEFDAFYFLSESF